MSKLAERGQQASLEHDQDTLDDSVPVMVVVIEPQQCWIAAETDYGVGLTLLAVMSEDPACWRDVPKYWPRYRTDSVCQELPMQGWVRCDEATAWEAIGDHGNWLLFDLQDKRVITGKENQDFSKDMTLAMQTDAQGKQSAPLPVHLPPWWELQQKVDAADVSRRRASACNVPRADRELLYGAPLIEDLASRIIDMALAGRASRLKALQRAGDQPAGADDSAVDRTVLQAWYALTVEVHREWLMTARDDLGGGRPRDLLHGAHDWSDALIAGQRRRFDGGAPLVAAPEDVLGVADAPLGSQELIVYFDMCREIIQAGWGWVAAQTELKRDARSQLVAYLQKVRDEWLELPYEGGAPPRFIIACSRRRVPRGSGVAIQGMDECQPAAHPGDCDCPICNMLASGMFGTSFTSLVGHHLELDDEFAFSMFEKYEDWEEQSIEWREISGDGEGEGEAELGSTAGAAAAKPLASLRPDEQLDEEFTSAWSSRLSDEPLPGDRRGFLKLAFRLAEVVADLESLSAPRQHIVRLNQTFRCCFESDATTSAATKAAFKVALEQVAGQYPHLLPKLCDLQSQVDELGRRTSRC